ncbi:MAG: tRNA glutamyl-Q(34) synthetase GluQRS [Sphingomonadaceae bacterium]|nr:tRNA glutamyl-Q(34) synthetase GluQRS [Sphingomonadaceae bacterium]
MTAFCATHGQAPISRFAPSPTGQLHLGHAFSAVRAHDIAAGGRFLVRIEDIDDGRARPGSVDAIFEDLAWLGLGWDAEMAVQSERGARYDAALARLDAMGLTYRCVCTRAEVAEAASAPQGDLPPVYPGTCRRTSIALDDKRPFCLRLDMAQAIALAGPLEWEDADAGTVCADPAPFGDIVIARKDAGASYHLAATVDDAAQGVTDVARGRDLFTATHVHRLLQALLELPTPRYHHHPLVLGPDGKRLAKRTPGATLADLRASGADPAALVAGLRAGRLPIGFAFDGA